MKQIKSPDTLLHLQEQMLLRWLMAQAEKTIKSKRMQQTDRKKVHVSCGAKMCVYFFGDEIS